MRTETDKMPESTISPIGNAPASLMTDLDKGLFLSFVRPPGGNSTESRCQTGLRPLPLSRRSFGLWHMACLSCRREDSCTGCSRRRDMTSVKKSQSPASGSCPEIPDTFHIETGSSTRHKPGQSPSNGFQKNSRSCLNLFVQAIGRGFGGMTRRFSKEDSQAIGHEKRKR